jgi:uncharacterized membrane protein
MPIIEINSDYILAFNSLQVFVLMIFIIWIILLIFSLKRYGVKKTIRYFVPIFLAALIGELCAVGNQGFEYPGYLLYVNAFGGSVPIIIGLGWSVNLFLFLHLGKDVVSRFYKKTNFKQTFLISMCSGFFALCLNTLEDPLAHHNSWWIWNKSIERIYIADVPLANYLGWFLIVGGMTLLTIMIDRSKYSDNRKLLINLIAPFIIFMILGPYFLML